MTNIAFLKRPIETFSTTVSLRPSNNSDAVRGALELELIEKIADSVLRAVIYPKPQAAFSVGVRGAELGFGSLRYRLQCHKVVAGLHRMDNTHTADVGLLKAP